MIKKNIPIWQDPRIFEIGRRKLSASASRFIDRKSALDEEPFPLKFSLNGSWKFSWIPSIDQAPASFYKVDFDDSDWDEIMVPGVWQLQGYGAPHYRNIGLPPGPDPKNPPRIDPSLNSLGCYRTVFTLPDDWIAERVIVSFDGVKTAFEAWLNGEYLGYSQDSCLPAEFEITSVLRSGKNQLAVKVYRFCDGSFLEDQDMWYLNGIFRDVTIYQIPRIQIEDFYLRCKFDVEYQDALFLADIDLEVLEPPGGDLQLMIELMDPDGGEVFSIAKAIQLGSIDKTIQFEQTVSRPERWSAENPALYTVLLSLRDQDGKDIQVIPVPFGFRIVEIIGGQLRVNGEPVLMRGVNRHDFDPRRGPAVSRESMEEQIKQLKRFNINAIRTAHYPNQSYLYELCDRYGIYVMDEANLESHSFLKHLPRGKEQWRDAVIARGTRMVRRDRNHPSILFWSLGNEAGSGDNFRLLRQAMEELDHTRPIHYEGEYTYPNSDFVSMMYPSPEFLEKVAQGKGPLWFFKAEGVAGKPVWPRFYREKPILICEYAHAMGNSISRLDRFMEIFEEFPRCAGGYIWDMIDQSLLRMGEDGTEQWTYGGDWGDEPNDGPFCINGLFQPDLTPNPPAYEVQKVYQPVAVDCEGLQTGELFIVNKRSFADLGDLDIQWTLTRDGELVDSGILPALPVPPGETRIQHIPLVDLIQGSGEHHLLVEFLLNQDTPWEEKGYRVAWEQLHLSRWQVEAAPEAILSGPPTTSMLIQPREDELDILVNEIKLCFDTGTGYMKSYSRGGSPLLVGPLRSNFYRRLDNDFLPETLAPVLAGLLSLNKKWESAERHLKLTDFQLDKENTGAVLISAQYNLPQGSSPFRITYHIDLEGKIEVRCELRPRREMLRFGLQVSISKALQQTTWFGRGPHETMPDRKTSGLTGIHSLPSDQMHFPYIHPQENGNRSDVRWVKFQDEKGTGLHLESLDDGFFNFSLWPYTQQDLNNARHIHELPERGQYTLNIDLAQRGVGDLFSLMYGRDPGTRLKRGKTYQFGIRISPIISQ